LNPLTFGVSTIPGVEDMSGVYICGAASILTERVIVTGQTLVSAEHVDGTGLVVFSEAGERHPALTRSAISMIRSARITQGGGKFCWFFSDMGYLIVTGNHSPNMKSNW
jgi:L-asparaginase II